MQGGNKQPCKRGRLQQNRAPRYLRHLREKQNNANCVYLMRTKAFPNESQNTAGVRGPCLLFWHRVVVLAAKRLRADKYADVTPEP